MRFAWRVVGSGLPSGPGTRTNTYLTRAWRELPPASITVTCIRHVFVLISDPLSIPRPSLSLLHDMNPVTLFVFRGSCFSAHVVVIARSSYELYLSYCLLKSLCYCCLSLSTHTSTLIPSTTLILTPHPLPILESHPESLTLSPRLRISHHLLLSPLLTPFLLPSLVSHSPQTSSLSLKIQPSFYRCLCKMRYIKGINEKKGGRRWR